MKKCYTVIFYIDAAYGVETFAEEVKAENTAEAWDKAVAKAYRSGGSSSGRTLTLREFHAATEIITLHGHGLAA